MGNFELLDFNKRIGLNTSLDDVSVEICRYYDLGTFVSNELITIGYEDYNYYLTTSKGKFCVKIFNNGRTKEDIDNYLERIKAVANSEISSPEPLKINNDVMFSLDYLGNHYSICVFEYISGKTIFNCNKILKKVL